MARGVFVACESRSLTPRIKYGGAVWLIAVTGVNDQLTFPRRAKARGLAGKVVNSSKVSKMACVYLTIQTYLRGAREPHEAGSEKKENELEERKKS